MSVIEVKHVTKDYGQGRGIFDVSFEIKKGEVFGFLGPNGAGKTTTIRHLMGFIQPDEGELYINGKDTWKSTAHRYAFRRRRATNSCRPYSCSTPT